MKKRNCSSFLIAIAILFSCNDVKRDVSTSDTIAKVKHSIESVKSEESGSASSTKRDISSGVNYVFSNDTLCQELSIKEKSINKEFKIPETVEFQLTLRDKQHKFEDRNFKGVAKLTSSEESFSDNTEKDGGAYFAADYVFDTPDYSIQIRLDIDTYEACVISINTSKPDIILSGFSTYLKTFPDDGVMKKGQCQ